LENDAELKLKEKLIALLAAERELREALQGFDDDLDTDLLDADLLAADLPDTLDSLDAALARVPLLERWSDLLRKLRRPDRTRIPDGALDARGADVSQYFVRR